MKCTSKLANCVTVMIVVHLRSRGFEVYRERRGEFMFSSAPRPSDAHWHSTTASPAHSTGPRPLGSSKSRADDDDDIIGVGCCSRRRRTLSKKGAREPKRTKKRDLFLANLVATKRCVPAACFRLSVGLVGGGAAGAACASARRRRTGRFVTQLFQKYGPLKPTKWS